MRRPIHMSISRLLAIGRMTQHDLWTQAEDWTALQGRDALLVLGDREKLEALGQDFQAIEPAGADPRLEVIYSGRELRSFYLYWGRGFSGRPAWLARQDAK